MTNVTLSPGPAIGRAAKTFRESRGLGLREVSRTVGISPSYLCKLERGEVENPGVGVVMAIAHAIGSTVGELLGETGQGRVRDAAEEVRLRRALRDVGRRALEAAEAKP